MIQLNRQDYPPFYGDSVAAFNQYQRDLADGTLTKAKYDEYVANLTRNSGFQDILNKATNGTPIPSSSQARTEPGVATPGALALGNNLSLSKVGIQPQQTSGGPDPSSGARGIRVQLANGTTQIFPNIDESLNQALKAGGKVVGPDGRLAQMQLLPDGGWLADGQGLDKWLSRGAPPAGTYSGGPVAAPTSGQQAPVSAPTGTFTGGPTPTTAGTETGGPRTGPTPFQPFGAPADPSQQSIPAGTNGTPFLNYGTPNTGAPPLRTGGTEPPPVGLGSVGVQSPPTGPMSSGTQFSPAPTQAQPGSQQYPNHIKVRMPDGTFKDFDSISPDMDAALKAGGIPIDPTDGTEMKVTSGVHGNGYLFNGLPINIVMGGQWAPGQQQALGNYYSAGYTPGGQALPNEPALPAGASGATGQPGAAGGNNPFDFGYLTQPFNEEFQAPGGKPAPFTEQFNGQKFTDQFVPTTAADVNADPGIQFALDEAQKALERKGSAQQYMGTPRLGKELTRFTEDYASTKFNDVNNRRLTDYGLQKDLANQNYGQNLTEYQLRQQQNQQDINNWNTDWTQAMSQFAQKRDIFRGNRSDIYGYIAPIAGLGQGAAATTGNYGNIYGTQAGANINATGVTGANASIAQGNAWQTGIANATKYGLNKVGIQ